MAFGSNFDVYTGNTQTQKHIYISYNICDILKKKIEVDNIINVNKSESKIKSEIIFKEQEGYMYVKLK